MLNVAMAEHTNARRVFVALMLLSIFLLALLMSPFIQAFIFATVLAAMLVPLHEKLAKKLGNRPQLSAAIVCLGVLLAIILPLGGIVAFVVKEVIAGVRFLSETLQSDGAMGLLDKLPDSIQDGASRLVRAAGLEGEELNAELKRQANQHGGRVAGMVSGALAATGAALIQATMMMIAFFFLLIDGRDLVLWIEEKSPLRKGQVRELLKEFRRASNAVLVSSVATAGVQAAAAFIGYLIARVPQPVFFALVTFFVAFIPAVGAGGVCLVTALLVLALGHPWAALFLAIWGAVVVGLVDNLIKPILVKRGMHLHGGLVFFSLIGGLAVFGAVGLVVGPLIVTFFLALIRIYSRDFGDPKDEEPGELDRVAT